MATYKSIRIPAPGELWRHGAFSYYIVLANSNFQGLHFEPSGIANSSVLRQRIAQTCLTPERYSGSGVCHGQNDWVCEADNWVDFVKEKFQRLVEGFRNTLEKCEKLLGTIK